MLASSASWRCPSCQMMNQPMSTRCTTCGRAPPGSSQNNTPPPAARGSSPMINGSSVPSATKATPQSHQSGNNMSTPTPPPASAPGGNPGFTEPRRNPPLGSTPSPIPSSSQGLPPAAAGGTPHSALGAISANTPAPPFSSAADHEHRTNTPPPGPIAAGGGSVHPTSTNRSGNGTPPPFSGQGGAASGTTPNPLAAVTPGMVMATGGRDMFSSSDQQQQQQQHQSGVRASNSRTPMHYQDPTTTAATTGGSRSQSQMTPPPSSPTPFPPQQSSSMHPMERKQYEREIEFLRGAVNESKKFGSEIENTVEYLTDLLRRKTLECESLRTLAQENYEPVRRAILEQHKSQKRVEKNSQQELKFFQGRIEQLYAERTTLLAENAALKQECGEVKRELVLAQTPASRPDEKSFFNRVLYQGRELPPYREFRVAVNAGHVPLMSQLTEMNSRETSVATKSKALDVCRILLEPGLMDRFSRFGLYTYLNHLLTALLVEQKINTDTFAAAISSSYKTHVNYIKDPPAPVTVSKNKHFEDKINGLYNTFLPEQTLELELLQRMYKGNEHELWASHIQAMAEFFEEREREENERMDRAVAEAEQRAKRKGLPAVDIKEAGELARRQIMQENAASRAASKVSREERRNWADDDYIEPTEGSDDDDDDQHGAAVSSSAGGGSPRSSQRRGGRGGGASPGEGGGAGISAQTMDLHTRIALMCCKYNPQKLYSKDLSKTMAKYPPEVLLAAFIEKYGPEPEGDERKKLLEELADI